MSDFPKMLYLNGQAYTETGRAAPHQNTLLVNDAAEEAEGNAAGFTVANLPAGGDDTITGSEGDDTLLGHGGDDTISGATGADSLAGSEGADAPAPEAA